MGGGKTLLLSIKLFLLALNVVKTFGINSCRGLTREMMEIRASFLPQAKSKHVSVIFCSGDDP